MNNKKIKITIEVEDKEPQVHEVNGIAAVMISEGSDDEHHTISNLICGCLSVKDLLHIYDAISEELTPALEENIIKSMSPADLMKVLLRGGKHGSDR